MAKILVADDDAGILDAVTILLEEEGYEVMSSANGDAVWDAKKEKVDLILLDIWLSGQDGREICRQFKETPEGKSIPVILVSANSDTQQHAGKAKADDFLLKPFDINDLLEKVEKYLKKN